MHHNNSTAPAESPTPTAALPAKILVINPGSTSTKIAVYHDDRLVMGKSIVHDATDLSRFGEAHNQLSFRQRLVLEELERHGIALNFDAVIGRGGLTKPIPSGVYAVNRKMMDDTRHALRRHACNLGCIIASEIATLCGSTCRAFIADPGVVDELDEVARITGSPLMPRITIWHALNQRAIARRYAAEHGLTYEHLDLIVCHLGGGISVAAHHLGRAIDVNNALDGEGPFSPERAGTLPAADLIHLCFSGQYSERELLKRIAGQAGLAALLGTTDVKEIIRRIEAGDSHAELVLDAMTYQTAKAIAAQGAVLKGHIDAILLTGGMAHSYYITSHIKERVAHMGPIFVYPGEDEMQALALNALAALRGEREVRVYE